MKYLTLIALASLFSFSAFAEKLAVECVAPRMLTGGASIQLADLTSGRKTPQGYVTYKGELKVTIGGSTRQPIFNDSVKVKGVALEGGALLLQSSNPKISTIYMNQDSISYVEMADGKSYNTDCRFY